MAIRLSKAEKSIVRGAVLSESERSVARKMKAGDLRPVDMKLLRAALASNGGGVNADLYSDASRTRLMNAGLLQWKPNQKVVRIMLLTITPAGREKIKAEDAMQQG